MSDILHSGNKTGHMCESARMLPYLRATRHNKYGQQTLPLYLSKIKKLPETSREVHNVLTTVGRRADGPQHGVSPDMLPEQI